MKRRKCYRYSCDYCSKSGCSGGHIAKHERKCTANPNRVCGMCALVGEQQKPMSELFVPIQSAIAYFKPTGGIPDEVDVCGLRELTKNCPACMLAALRQFKEFGGYTITTNSTDFDFKAECKTWLSQYQQSCTAQAKTVGEEYHFDREEWLATWRSCLPVDKPLRVNLLPVEIPVTGLCDLPF